MPIVALIPAHDEASSISACVESLRAQSYPPGLYRIVVVADNCSDDTAAIASAAGAQDVMSRQDRHARGKGHALRWALDRLLSEADWDAVVVVDADAHADPELLLRLVQRFEAGAQAVQGESLLVGDGSVSATLRTVAFLLNNRVRPAGRAALGLPTPLAGTGMLLSRTVLREHPWNAFSSAEDVEYTLTLGLAGIHPAFAPRAIVLSPTAPTREAAALQQLRWEGGKAHLARTWLPRLIRRAFADRRPGLLWLAWELASPPLGVLVAVVVPAVVLGAVLAALGAIAAPAIAVWLIAAVATALFVGLGMRAGHCPRASYRALVHAPRLVVAKALGLGPVLRFRGDVWTRTERPTNVR